MAFSRISFPAGFFDIPGADTPSAATPQRDDDTHTASTASQHPGSQDPTPAFDTPFPLHAVARERPSLSPLFIPPPFASNLARSRTAGTPDSGYHSAFTPASSHHFGAPRNTPSSPLQHRFTAPLRLSDDEDDEDDNDDEPAAPNATQSDTARLLSLYKAGVVKAEVGENKIWKLQCNRCSIWVGTSVPQRIPLASAGQFRPLESHQSGKKCPYSPQFIRGSTAPPAPQTLPDEPMHVDSDSDEDDFQFQHGRSSSCPPEDTSARLRILACPKRDWFDHHLSEADKKTLSFGTIFTEQLLCKVGLWKRRMQSMAKVDLSARAQELFEEAQPWIKGENFQTHTNGHPVVHKL
ncbi:hypothetical protein B0H14DRAFT_2649580 [Mycena olivaceomarginata]|nr:hypothetical protein B0H14DRAFT_2649580 [Mycena olivaceomarginata]